jgi:hypothetical protein
MATGQTPLYNFPYPKPTDPVDVADDIKSLALSIDGILPELTTPNTKIEAINATASAIAIGDPIYISGLDSLTGLSEVSQSRADDPATLPAIGISASIIPPGNIGQVVLAGVVDADLDTSEYAVGQILYVAPEGGLTDDQPVYPDYSQQIAVVLKSDLTTGRILMLSGNNSGPTTWGQLKYNS